MFPDFSPVDWAIVIGTIVSSATLIVVSFDFYWSYIATKRSDISARVSSFREPTARTNGNRSEIYSPCTLANEGEHSGVVHGAALALEADTLANEGERSGVVRAQEADIQFEPSGEELQWAEMKNTEERRGVVVSIDHLDNRSVSPHSTAEARLKLNARRFDPVIDLMDEEEAIQIQFQIHAEDNEGHYEVSYSDKIGLPS